MTEMAMKANWSEQLRREPAVATALAVFAGSAATILGAWYFQYVLKLPPCPLCLEERLPYHVVIPLSLLLAIAAIVRAPRALIIVGFLAIMAAMLCSAALGAYHAGVEWRWWPGPTDCSGPITDFTAKAAARSVAVDPRGALRRGGVALPRPFARRLQRADFAGARGDRRARFGGAQRPRLSRRLMRVKELSAPDRYRPSVVPLHVRLATLGPNGPGSAAVLEQRTLKQRRRAS